MMIVITGAAGFIGSNVVALLNNYGEAVAAVDAFGPGGASPEGRPYLDALPLRARVDKGELPAWLERNGEDVRAVLHLGACSDTLCTDRDYIMRNNFEYTRTLWRWCAKHQRVFVYASSAATYGDGSAGFDDECDQKKLRPLNLYGESKQRFDRWALEQEDAPPRWVGLKFFNVYGPHEDHKGRMASVAWHAFRQVRESGRIRLFRSYRKGVVDGEQRRDFVYVEDACEIARYFLETPASKVVPNGLYNAGTGQARTFLDLAKAVCSALGVPCEIEYIPMPEELRARYQYFTEARVDKLRRAGYARPFHSLEDGIERMKNLPV